MTLLCPTCGVEIMAHEAGECLNEWVRSQLGDPFRHNESFYFCSQSNRAALFLMKMVWEMDPYAFICRDHICMNVPVLDQGTIGITKGVSIKGETFPLRVCRAFLWLKAHTSTLGGAEGKP